MTVSGEGKMPTRNDVDMLGKKYGLKKKLINQIVEEVSEAVSNFQVYAEDNSVAPDTMKYIASKIDHNLIAFDNTKQVVRSKD